MEITQIFTPTVLVIFVSSIVGLIVKAVRMQTKVDRHDEEIGSLKETLVKQETVLDTHRENNDIHFNVRLQAEVDRRQGDRFKRVEDRLEHIEGKLDQLIAK